MAGAEPLTELHFFGIPTAYFDLFPKGIPVVIRTVVGTSLFCILHPDVADLPLGRITQSEFVLYVSSEAKLPDNVIQDLVAMLVLEGQAHFPVMIHQVTQGLQAAGEADFQPRELGVTVVQKDTVESTDVRITEHETRLVKEEIEVEIG